MSRRARRAPKRAYAGAGAEWCDGGHRIGLAIWLGTLARYRVHGGSLSGGWGVPDLGSMARLCGRRPGLMFAPALPWSTDGARAPGRAATDPWSGHVAARTPERSAS